MKFTVDASGAVKKTATLQTIHRAAIKQAQTWGGEAVFALKDRVRDMQGAGTGRKTSQLGRSIGMKTTGNIIQIGTNLNRVGDVKYARIQDEGGTTHPRVTPKMRRWAWWMYYKSKQLDAKYKAIALTKKATLTVKIPRSGWFTDTMDTWERVLPAYMDPMVLYREAEKMLGGK